MISCSNSGGWRRFFIRWTFLLATLCALLGKGLFAHVPVPDSVLDPKTPEEAWNVLRLATDNLARLLQENRLAEVPDQAALCAPALRLLPKVAGGPPDSRQLVAVEAVQAGVAMISLAQAAISGDKASAGGAFASLRDHLMRLSSEFDSRIVQSDVYYCPMHPDVVGTDPNGHCEKCGMALLKRRIPYSFVYVPAGEPSVRLTASAVPPLAPGRASRITIHLERHDGSPVAIPDLLVMHTQPIHLLIVDPGLLDYHHEHPTPTTIPGEYEFTFTPAMASRYRVFADIVPADTGMQEYPWTDLPAAGPTMSGNDVQGADTTKAQSDGLEFVLSHTGNSGGPVRAGELCALQIKVSDAATGKPSNALEPVMGAYAHLVGFYGDRRTVVHLHPFGPEISNQSARGGPILEFKFYPPKPGFVRLYCQVQRDGRAVYAAFNVNVAP